MFILFYLSAAANSFILSYLVLFVKHFLKLFFQNLFDWCFVVFSDLAILSLLKWFVNNFFRCFFSCCFSDACHEQLVYNITFELICQRLFSSFFKIFCRLCSLHDDYYIRLISFLQVFFLLISIFFLSYRLFVN